jgi:hypothetical protein
MYHGRRWRGPRPSGSPLARTSGVVGIASVNRTSARHVTDCVDQDRDYRHLAVVALVKVDGRIWRKTSEERRSIVVLQEHRRALPALAKGLNPDPILPIGVHSLLAKVTSLLTRQRTTRLDCLVAGTHAGSVGALIGVGQWGTQRTGKRGADK